MRHYRKIKFINTLSKQVKVIGIDSLNNSNEERRRGEFFEDVNARIGKMENTRKETGNRLTVLCSNNELRTNNTIFSHKDQYK